MKLDLVWGVILLGVVLKEENNLISIIIEEIICLLVKTSLGTVRKYFRDSK